MRIPARILSSILVLFTCSTLADWTNLPLRPGAKIIYVSSSGDDRNDGLTPSTARKTLASGFAAITDGAGDQLLLRRGDTFSELLQWGKSGFSAAYPAVLGAYGTGPRPIIDRGNEMGMIVSNRSAEEVKHMTELRQRQHEHERSAKELRRGCHPWRQ